MLEERPSQQSPKDNMLLMHFTCEAGRWVLYALGLRAVGMVFWEVDVFS